MTVFQNTWNASIPQSETPDVLAAITEKTVNDYLNAHRRNDSEKYSFTRVFSGDGQAKFQIEAVVEAPLRVDLPPFVPGSRNLIKIIEFPAGPRGGFQSRSVNLVRLYADNNTFRFSWTTSAGKSFAHELKKVMFRLDADLQIVTENAKNNLKFEVTALYIDQAQLKKMMQIWRAEEPSCAEKLDALFLSMLQVIAAQIAVQLKETIEIPVIDMGHIKLFASTLVLKNKTVVLAASGDIGAIVREFHARMQADCARVQEAFENDLERVGGVAALVFPSRTLARASRLDPASAEIFLLRSETRSAAQIWRDLRTTRSVVEQLPHRGGGARLPQRKGRKLALADVGLGVGLAEKLIQALASKAVPIDQRNCTKELSLALIKGRACANVHVWNPVITIGPGGLTGAVNLDVWAGIEYFLKKVWDCSWSWDGPHQIGVGLTGVPRLTLRTISNTSGLSIDARFDLSNVHLKTGINEIIDKIIAAIDGLFIAILEAILNSIAGLLSLVVVPVRISIPGQATGLRLSEFSTSLYARSQLKYLAVDCAAAPFKPS